MQNLNLSCFFIVNSEGCEDTQVQDHVCVGGLSSDLPLGGGISIYLHLMARDEVFTSLSGDITCDVTSLILQKNANAWRTKPKHKKTETI